jgi:hypothetical protein
MTLQIIIIAWLVADGLDAMNDLETEKGENKYDVTTHHYLHTASYEMEI